MKNLLNQVLILLLIIVFALILIGCNSSRDPAQNSTMTPDAFMASSTSEPLPTLTNSPIPPSETATEIPPIPTNTAQPTFTNTPTEIPPSATPTEEPPIATLYSYTVCRYGPGTIYPIHTSFKEDGFGWVRGRLDDDSWYLIELPDTGQTCWIFNEIVELNKSISLMPILTPPPKPTPAPAPTQSEEQKALGVKYYLIIPDNGGPFACGDGMAYFYSGQKGKGIEENIKLALNALFSVKTEYVGNYYNPVYKSSLKVKGVEVDNGYATIYLAGNFVKAKSECEAKRIHLQVWETARQFSQITHRPNIWVNNVLLGDLLEDVRK